MVAEPNIGIPFDLTGRNVVVTGANSGIGFAATRQMAAAGADVVMACRNANKAEDAARRIRESGVRGRVEIESLDLGDLASVRAFASRFVDSGRSIDVLLNNAGVMALDRTLTPDGLEAQIGINHFGHFALTGLLLPAIVRDGGGRVVNVSSMGHRPGRVDLDDLMYERRRYSRWGAYFQSKLANLLFTRELDRRLRQAENGVIGLCSHPGTARTELGKSGSSTTNFVMRNFTGVLIRSSEQGAEALVRACVDPEAEGGEFFGPRWLTHGQPRLETPSRRARDDADAARLWAISEELTGVTYPL
jgi:NAD(P)-dependent dehydrogenase (short-subunit alcohol dehydrogenase family)